MWLVGCVSSWMSGCGLGCVGKERFRLLGLLLLLLFYIFLLRQLFWLGGVLKMWLGVF